MLFYDATADTLNVIDTNPFRVVVQQVLMDDDGQVFWIEWAGLAAENAFMHHYKVGIEQAESNFISSLDQGFELDEQFLIGSGYVNFEDESRSLLIYDFPSTALTNFEVDGFNFVEAGAIEGSTLALIASQWDEEEYEYINPQVFLKTSCDATPHIVGHTSDLNVITGRSVLLSVEAKSDQAITYQWYQGEVGDTTVPLGENSASFTTPPITAVSQFWVRASNTHGWEDSTTIVLTPGNTAELVTNGGFEIEGVYASVPLNWGDWGTRRCNQPDKPAPVHNGECAVRLKQTAAQTAFSSQMLPINSLIAGDTLIFSAWIQGKNISSTASAKLRIRYSDATPKAKVKLAPNLGNYAYTQFTGAPLTIGGAVSDAQIRFQFKQGQGGVMWIDDVSVIQSPGTAAKLLSLPESSGSGRGK